MATGRPYPLNNISFNNIEIVSAMECEELRSLSSVERLQLSSKMELEFYRGYPVAWTNFGSQMMLNKTMFFVGIITRILRLQ